MESLHLAKLVVLLIAAAHIFQDVRASDDCGINCNGAAVPYPCPGHPNLVCMPDGVCRVCCCNETSQCSYIGNTGRTRCNCPDGATGAHCFCPVPEDQSASCGCSDAYGLLKACSQYTTNFERSHQKKIEWDWVGNSYNVFNYTMDQDVETVDDCRNNCLENPLCRFFNFKVSNRNADDIVCQYFTPQSVVNNNVMFDNNGDWEVYSRECAVC